jgi:hypothetical protein
MKHILLYLIALMVLFTGPSFANGILEHTAIEALRVAKHSANGTMIEHGGMLVRHNSFVGPMYEYIQMPPGRFAGVTVVDMKLLGETDELIGTYHVHPCMNGYANSMFSQTDVITAIFSRVPEFMLDSCTGLVHEFDAKIDKIHDTGEDVRIDDGSPSGKEVHLPYGRIIGDIEETEPKHDAPKEMK